MRSYDDCMAYNIYSDPDLSNTSKTFKSFVIDFKGVKTPIHTYWALCNFGLNFSDAARAEYPGIKGGGAYAGLQNRDDGRMAIMSFWEMVYGDDNKILRAARVFPYGVESCFGGEGEGTNYIGKYNWRTDSWYRMVIKSWQDKESGRTFVGQWVCDLEENRWTLISYFNTKLTDACLRGGMSLFQENYIGGVNQFVEREFHAKNMYVLDAVSDKWVSIDTTTLVYGNGGADNKAGGHSFGATEDYFWGISGGTTGELSQEEYEAAAVVRDTFTIKQPDQPTFNEIDIEKFSIKRNKEDKLVAFWRKKDGTAPQLGYRIEISNGKTTAVFERTRPEICEVVLKGIDGDRLKVKFTLTDIFGGSKTILSEVIREREKYKEKHG